MSNNKSPAQNQKERLIAIFNSLKETDRLTKSVETKPQTIDEVTKKWDMNDKVVELFADNIKKDTELKGKYAIILIIILIFQLVVLNVIFILKGINLLSYSDNTFNIFITGGIAEIFLLVKTIVKYLFKDNITNSLNIILKNNNRWDKQSNIKNNSKNIKNTYLKK